MKSQRKNSWKRAAIATAIYVAIRKILVPQQEKKLEIQLS
jgi:hypothetical protein